MCDYCDKNNTFENLKGMDGIVEYTKNNYVIYAEHFKNEKTIISDIKFCPMCGREFENK